MTDYTCLDVLQDGDIRWLTLNRPHKVNAFDAALWDELSHALDDAERAPDARVVVVRGAGGHFSAGYDLPAALSELENASPDAIREHIARGNRACWAAWNMDKPVIAAIEGYCLGGGFEFAMCCDFVVAEESARFGEPEGRVAASAPFLITPWVMSMRHAKEILLLGETVDAARAERMGIINEICTAGEIEACVRRWARRLLGFDPDIWAANKRALNRSYEIRGFRESVMMGEDAFVQMSYIPSRFRDELAARVKGEGFARAMKWVQGRHE